MKKLIQALVDMIKNRKDENGKKKDIRIIFKKTFKW